MTTRKKCACAISKGSLNTKLPFDKFKLARVLTGAHFGSARPPRIDGRKRQASRHQGGQEGGEKVGRGSPRSESLCPTEVTPSSSSAVGQGGAQVRA